MNELKSNKLSLKLASNAALFSLLNLSILPVVAFIALLRVYLKSEQGSIARYHAVLGIKINVIAAIALFLVSGLMILFGGFESPWTWVYVISYFIMVHSLFIVIAVWALVRAWSGNQLRAQA